MRVRKKKDNAKFSANPSIQDLSLESDQDESMSEDPPLGSEGQEMAPCGGLIEGEELTSGSTPHTATKAAVNPLILNLTASLIRKLQYKAQIEGVSIEELATELLSEGIVLRAWEIMEKKTAMKGVPQGGGVPQNMRNQQRSGFRQQNNNFSRNNRNQGNDPVGFGGQQGGGGNGRHGYRNIMEDNANFMEYLRTQEKKQPR